MYVLILCMPSMYVLASAQKHIAVYEVNCESWQVPTKSIRIKQRGSETETLSGICVSERTLVLVMSKAGARDYSKHPPWFCSRFWPQVWRVTIPDTFIERQGMPCWDIFSPSRSRCLQACFKMKLLIMTNFRRKKWHQPWMIKKL